jgi:hypothetical protein
MPPVVQFVSHLLGEVCEGRAAADVERDRDGLAPVAFDRGDGVLRTFGVGVVGQDDPGASFGDPCGCGLSDAGASSGDNGDLHAGSSWFGMVRANQPERAERETQPVELLHDPAQFVPDVMRSTRPVEGWCVHSCP